MFGACSVVLFGCSFSPDGSFCEPSYLRFEQSFLLFYVVFACRDVLPLAVMLQFSIMFHIGLLAVFILRVDGVGVHVL